MSDTFLLVFKIIHQFASFIVIPTWDKEVKFHIYTSMSLNVLDVWVSSKKKMLTIFFVWNFFNFFLQNCAHKTRVYKHVKLYFCLKDRLLLIIFWQYIELRFGHMCRVIGSIIYLTWMVSIDILEPF